MKNRNELFVVGGILVCLILVSVVLNRAAKPKITEADMVYVVDSNAMFIAADDDFTLPVFLVESSYSTFIMEDGGDIAFQHNDKDILRFKPSGVVYVQGRKTTRDIKVYRAFRGWLEKTIGIMETWEEEK